LYAADLFPKIKKRDPKPGALAAPLAATGTQAETVPPSLVLITTGLVTDGTGAVCAGLAQKSLPAKGPPPLTVKKGYPPF
jgi:hypothetical protein